MQDLELSVPVLCSASLDPATGSDCNVSTTADTLVPGYAREGSRAVISTFSVNVEDAGPDGDVGSAASGCPLTCGSGDEAVFLRQGVVTP